MATAKCLEVGQNIYGLHVDFDRPLSGGDAASEWAALSGGTDAKLTLLHKAAVAACSGKGNGLASDSFIADALECKYDPAELTAKMPNRIVV